MSIDTYLLLPAANPRRTAGLFADHTPGSVSHVGVDYVVLHLTERHAAVVDDAEERGPQLASLLPAVVRKELDPRGLLAVPEVGQSFPLRYADAVADHSEPDWLPTKRRRASRKQRRLLLVSLSATRQKMLSERPEVVREVLEARGKRAIPGSLEMGPTWIALQRVLFDAAWLAGRDDGDAEPLAPRKGMSYFESRVVEASRVISRQTARSVGSWLATLGDSVVQAVASHPETSPAAHDFPESLGTCEADDHDPAPQQTPARKPRGRHVAELDVELRRLRDFYAAVIEQDRAVLSIRFRAAPLPLAPSP